MTRFCTIFGMVACLALCGACTRETPPPETEAMPEPAPDALVSARLIADVASVAPGTVFSAGVLISIAPGSHIYWRNPGDSGLPTDVEWKLPPGFSVGALQWPAPVQFDFEDIGESSFGYEGQVLLFAEVTAPNSLDPEPFEIGAEVDWLNCQEDGMCIPGAASPALTLPVGNAEPSEHISDFESFRETVPRDAADTPVLWQSEAGAAGIAIWPQAPWRFVDARVRFFPETGGAWEVAAEFADNVNGGIHLRPKSDEGEARGVLSVFMTREDTGGEQAFHVLVGN